MTKQQQFNQEDRALSNRMDKEAEKRNKLVFNNFIDLAKSFDELTKEYVSKSDNTIILSDLAMNADIKTSLGAAIINAISSKKYTTDEIISFVKDQAKDNPTLMTEVIGKDLTDKILNL